MRHTARKPTGNFQTTFQQVVLLLPSASLGEVEPALSALEPPNGVIHFLGWQSALPRFCITQRSILGANSRIPPITGIVLFGCTAMLLRDFAPVCNPNGDGTRERVDKAKLGTDPITRSISFERRIRRELPPYSRPLLLRDGEIGAHVSL